ncbi:hypothetical protein BURPS305_1853 [Burkholderia pseudomallei 305]|nr:hypothetical protein BURPS305_1853 [Burkholderia pseudomallei 305]
MAAADFAAGADAGRSMRGGEGRRATETARRRLGGGERIPGG